MGKHICIHCGKRRVNIDVGLRYIKVIGQPQIVGFVHNDCKEKTRPHRVDNRMAVM